MRRAPDKIWDFVAPIVTGLGYQHVGTGLGQTESGLTLRVYIDGTDGITVDDCAAVSGQVGAALDVEDLISGEYCLEVSSPGMDRPLFDIEHYQSQVGNNVKVRMAVPLDGRRNFKGLLSDVGDDHIFVEVDGELYELAVRDIESANVVSQFGG
jgi:ribosome maturation factor RimP